MADVELEAVTGLQDGRHPLAAPLVDLPGVAAVRAVEVTVPTGRKDVVLLAPIGIVAMAHEPELLE